MNILHTYNAPERRNPLPPPPAPLLLPPTQYGLPGKFTSYRTNQDVAIVRGVTSPARFVAQSAPVGFGKSMNAILQAVLMGKRTVILTATKGLQDQYARDFGAMGIVDQRGRDNYPCPSNPETDTCENSPCLGGLRCHYRKQGACPYANSVTAFNEARIAVTNYSWWLSVGKGGRLTPPELLVLDEAHDSPHQLEAVLAFTLFDSDIRKWLNPGPPPNPPSDEFFVTQDWAQWARGQASLLAFQIEELETQAKKGGLTNTEWNGLKARRRLFEAMGLLGSAGHDCLWVWERLRDQQAWQFNPLHPAQFAEKYLFRGTPRVLLTSGTITPKTCYTLNLGPHNTDFQDYPSPFNPARAPIYRFNTGIRWDKRTSESDLRVLVSMMDNLINARRDRKGIIHSVSFIRQQFIYGTSQNANLMWGNSRARRGGGGGGNGRNTPAAMDPTTTAKVVAAFKQSPPPALLISPSITTGWDFPGPECEYQLIPKLPFPDASSRIMKARAKVDPEYAAHLCAVELQQMCGRGMRTPEDQCETIIMDGHALWFLSKNRHLFNSSFWQFARQCDTPPPPPPALPRHGW